MKNAKELKTTLLGVLCILYAIADTWYFGSIESDITHGAIAFVGIMLVLAPDRIINWMFKKWGDE